MRINEKLLPEVNYVVASMASNYTINAINTQETLPLTLTKYGVGNKLTVSNNGVVIGKGVSKVLVSAQVYWYTTVSGSEGIVYIAKNGQNYSISNRKFADNYEHQVTPTIAIPVQEGDIITLKVLNQQNKSVISYYDSGTFLNVVAIDNGVTSPPEADYITERGNSNGWAWTKYKSGRIELTGWVQYTGITCTNQSAGTYYGGSKTTTMPFSLMSLYLITTQETSSRSSGIYVYGATVSGATVTTEFRAHASVSNGSCGVFYHVIGYL